ncbi:hypothetical protein ACHAPM_010245 [Fusarium culmorum]
MDEDNAWEGLSDGLVSSGDEENYGDASWDLVSSDDEGNSQDASYALDLGDDFGTSDISTWLHENKAAWPPGKTPDEDDWARIRCTGSRSKKTWDLNMAIEAAFREFRLAGAPVDVEQRRILHESHSTRLLRQVIYHMRRYFNENRNSSAESSLVRKTRAAACRARLNRMAGGTPEEVSKHFPAHSKVIACRLVHPFGDIDGHIAAALLNCNQSYILGVPSDEAAHTCLSGNMSGESGTPSSQGAMALAMNLQPEVDSIREHQNSDTIKLRAQINAIKEQESSYKAQVKSLPK